MTSIEFQFLKINFASPLYVEFFEIRNNELRKPLGLQFFEKDIQDEYADHHFVVLDKNHHVLGGLIFKEISSNSLKMKQVVIKPEFQGKGLGYQLVKYAEDWAYSNGFNSLELNARKNVVGFYENLKYDLVSNEFMEVGIPHFKMKKEFKECTNPNL